MEEAAPENAGISTHLPLNKADRIWQGLQESCLGHLSYRLWERECVDSRS
jgi:hypothetical protein